MGDVCPSPTMALDLSITKMVGMNEQMRGDNDSPLDLSLKTPVDLSTKKSGRRPPPSSQRRRRMGVNPPPPPPVQQGRAMSYCQDDDVEKVMDMDAAAATLTPVNGFSHQNRKRGVPTKRITMNGPGFEIQLQKLLTPGFRASNEDQENQVKGAPKTIRRQMARKRPFARPLKYDEDSSPSSSPSPPPAVPAKRSKLMKAKRQVGGRKTKVKLGKPNSLKSTKINSEPPTPPVASLVSRDSKGLLTIKTSPSKRQFICGSGQLISSKGKITMQDIHLAIEKCQQENVKITSIQIEGTHYDNPTIAEVLPKLEFPKISSCQIKLQQMEKRMRHLIECLTNINLAKFLFFLDLQQLAAIDLELVFNGITIIRNNLKEKTLAMSLLKDAYTSFPNVDMTAVHKLALGYCDNPKIFFTQTKESYMSITDLAIVGCKLPQSDVMKTHGDGEGEACSQLSTFTSSQPQTQSTYQSPLLLLRRLKNLKNLIWRDLNNKRFYLNKLFRSEEARERLERLTLSDTILIVKGQDVPFKNIIRLSLFNVLWEPFPDASLISKMFPALEILEWGGPSHKPSLRLLKNLLRLENLGSMKFLKFWYFDWGDERPAEVVKALLDASIHTKTEHFELKLSRFGTWMGQEKRVSDYSDQVFNVFEMQTFFQDVETQNKFESVFVN